MFQVRLGGFCTGKMSLRSAIAFTKHRLSENRLQYVGILHCGYEIAWSEYGAAFTDKDVQTALARHAAQTIKEALAQ